MQGRSAMTIVLGVMFVWFAVCISVLDKIDESLEGKDKKSKPKIEAAIEKFCSKKELSASEKKVVCWSCVQPPPNPP